MQIIFKNIVESPRPPSIKDASRLGFQILKKEQEKLDYFLFAERSGLGHLFTTETLELSDEELDALTFDNVYWSWALALPNEYPSCVSTLFEPNKHYYHINYANEDVCKIINKGRELGIFGDIIFNHKSTSDPYLIIERSAPLRKLDTIVFKTETYADIFMKMDFPFDKEFYLCDNFNLLAPYIGSLIEQKPNSIAFVKSNNNFLFSL